MGFMIWTETTVIGALVDSFSTWVIESNAFVSKLEGTIELGRTGPIRVLVFAMFFTFFFHHDFTVFFIDSSLNDAEAFGANGLGCVG